jgi:hypothetical protein
MPPTRVACIALALAACHQTTAKLSVDLDTRFAAEGISHRADDQVFRYSYYSRSSNGSSWENRDASIIVTKRTVYIHKNEKVGLEIVPGGRKEYEVRREADRVIIGAGSGKSHVSWSFRPPDDPDAWESDIRAVIHSGR